MSFFQVGGSPVMTNKSEVLALKYRPQSFKDLIGHEEITSTIFNSIKSKKSPNAYLFTGIRGIGKTTFARIVAKALNCKNGVQNLCESNFCEHCNSIIKSNHIDVLEIDAASKTGVDDVRELIEFSRYAPSISKFKIFIIDEVHMLSKQAFNALLKTLEEPPEYLKFIFATTEVKKIPITVLSRCQRYDLFRIKSDDLFQYIQKISHKEKKKIEENAIKLIVKISEGSVRDALSLLDRSIISSDDKLITFEDVQKIFGYVDKSSYINLLEYIFKGDEEAALKHYRSLYNTGVEHNIFLNEFLEVLYYLKNILNIKLESTNFSLNDNDYKNILHLSKQIKPNDILLIWEVTLKTIKEINLVSNPSLSIEMFLIQLMYLKKKKVKTNEDNSLTQNNLSKKEISSTEAVSQIKTIKQEEEKNQINIDKNGNRIKNLEDLINACLQKKEMKLKYELENNVNLVSFSENRIEISFNEKLNNSFVKDLSEKLFEWTKIRWIISFSKKKGNLSKKEMRNKLINKNLETYKNSKEYLEISKIFPDIELLDIKKND